MPTYTLRPNGQGAGDWTGSNAGALATNIDESALDYGDYIVSSGAAGSYQEVRFDTAALAANVTVIHLYLNGSSGMYGGTVDVQMRTDGGSWSTAQSVFGYGGGPAMVEFTGSWNQASIDSLEVKVTDVYGASYYYSGAVIYQMYAVAIVPGASVAYGPVDDEMMADTPKAFWRFNESSAPLLDETSTNWDLTGGAGLTPEGETAFDGTSDRSIYIDGTLTSNLSGSVSWTPGDYTFEWWIRPTGFPHGLNQTMQWGNNVFHMSSDGSGYCGMFGGNRMDPSELVAGTMQPYAWHLITFTFEANTGAGPTGTGRFYVNGVLKYTKTGMNQAAVNALTIHTGSNGIVGYLDNMAFYNSRLAQSRIQAHYDARAAEGVYVIPFTGLADSQVMPFNYGSHGNVTVTYSSTCRAWNTGYGSLSGVCWINGSNASITLAAPAGFKVRLLSWDFGSWGSAANTVAWTLYGDDGSPTPTTSRQTASGVAVSTGTHVTPSSHLYRYVQLYWAETGDVAVDNVEYELVADEEEPPPPEEATVGPMFMVF